MDNTKEKIIDSHENMLLEKFFCDVDFSSFFGSENMKEVIKEEFYFWSEDIDSDSYEEFWDFFLGNKIKKKDYVKIRKIYINKELKIETNNISTEDIIEEIQDRFLKKIFF